MTDFKTWKSDSNSWFTCNPGKNGFLPIGQPLKDLPDKYQVINDILDKMKLCNNGYLSRGELYNVITKDLPLFDFGEEHDVQLIAALLRDYFFMAAAYSLEPCHISLMENGDGNYGLARDRLPKQLAEPLITLAKKCEVYPWMDYAHGYGLNNAVLKEGEDPTNHKSYDTIRTFNGHDSEQGFINVHVAMVSQSPDLLKYQQDCLQDIYTDSRDEFNHNLESHFKTLHNIVDTLQTMWKASKYGDYLSFRTFIMGQIGNNKCYPKEHIIFERTEKEEEIHAYRGETGAQDSIIPSVDNFLQIKYPLNKLTEYLFNLRNYRPKDHQKYINFVKQSSDDLEFKNYCLKSADTSVILLKNLNQVRMFRKKHWNLTKKYIIQNTKHPVATGGTPITTWLPNQLGATLEYMDDIVKQINEDEISDKYREFYNNLKLELSDHIQTIMDEVANLQVQFKNQNHSDFLKR